MARTMIEPMTEDALEESIRDLCQRLALLRFHCHDSRRSPAGWPDEAIVAGRTLHLWELKSETGRLSQAQRQWLAALADVTRVDVRVVRPLDLQAAAAALALARTERDLGHWPGCWRSHHGCAIHLVEQLRARLAELEGGAA